MRAGLGYSQQPINGGVRSICLTIQVINPHPMGQETNFDPGIFDIWYPTIPDVDVIDLSNPIPCRDRAAICQAFCSDIIRAHFPDKWTIFINGRLIGDADGLESDEIPVIRLVYRL